MDSPVDWMAGSSEVFRAFEAEITRLSAVSVSVSIEGESGTGKNAAARQLHRRGPRSGGPFVEVNLAALAPTLIEAELFGHAEGAFTGARSAKVGRFVRAAGGTLVLDGVEALPEEIQVKLLRVLQERLVEPLGAETAIPVDVRVLSTSIRDLKGEVRGRRFREDLYYRLAVVTVRVPPLRERLEDLDVLCAGLAKRTVARLAVAERPLSREALERLRSHAWPGNVRELENALERVHVLAPRARENGESGASAGPPIGPEEFAFLSEAGTGAAERLAREALANGLSVEAMEHAMIAEALREQRGNARAAAQRLGLSRRALDYRFEKWNEKSKEESGGTS